MNLFDYYTGKINKKDTMNLVIENGSYTTKEEIELRKKRFVKLLKNQIYGRVLLVLIMII